MSAEPTEDAINASAAVLKALAHEVRLMLMLALLQHGETSVSALESLTGIGQPGLSQQLAILRKAELVLTRRRAKMILYRIAPASLAPTARLLGAFAASGNGAEERSAPSPARPKAGSAATFARIL